MHTARDFLREIRRRPRSATARLIYADWLERSASLKSRQRGELIRMQHLQMQLSPQDPRYRELEARIQPLKERFQAGILHKLHLNRVDVSCIRFERGLVAELGIDALPFLRHSRRLFACLPALYGLSLWNARAYTPQLAKCRHLRWIRVLNLTHQALRQEDLVPLFQSPWIRPFRGLDLSGNPLGDATACELAKRPWLARLQALSLAHARLSSFGLQAFIDAGLAERVRNLDLYENQLGPESAQLWLTAPEAPALRRLVLTGNHLGDEAGEALAFSPLIGQVRRLSLADNQLGRRAILALFHSPQARRLRRLTLDNNLLDDEGAHLLASIRPSKRLKRLDLRNNRLTRSGVAALAASPFWRHVDLHIAQQHLDAESLLPLQFEFQPRVWFLAN